MDRKMHPGLVALVESLYAAYNQERTGNDG